MNVIIFGATGSIGKHLIEQSLKKGHQVTAFGRSIDQLASHQQLKKIKGNVFDLNAVQEAVKGQEAVIVVLGAGISSGSNVRSQGTLNIIKAMQNNGVKRLICQTTLGAGDSRGNLNFFWKYIMFGGLLKRMFLDHELQEKHVRNSSLNWTIVRPGSFTDGPKTGHYKHGFSPTDRSVNLKIARADVADFIVQQLDATHYLFKSPGLSY
ncbi:NAD(P)-dependent oxidoreductase [Aureispira anguillae]|uniref:SDR family oxidoreductase n=1 Tax=Aureispira anguillae TaxID=2864201 RepID=A0A915YFN8_9BACT|nr:NAD(P)-binding oxidoreductase [Aureispira anguillae]BDS12123.1 SDR family oxidoreductase [Aureispira anguillae]